MLLCCIGALSLRSVTIRSLQTKASMSRSASRRKDNYLKEWDNAPMEVWSRQVSWSSGIMPRWWCGTYRLP